MHLKNDEKLALLSLSTPAENTPHFPSALPVPLLSPLAHIFSFLPAERLEAGSLRGGGAARGGVAGSGGPAAPPSLQAGFFVPALQAYSPAVPATRRRRLAIVVSVFMLHRHLGDKSVGCKVGVMT